MVKYKTSSWFVDSEGNVGTINTRNHDDIYDAERQYHLYCAAAATSEHPIHVAVLETIDGTRIKQECYKHEAIADDNFVEEVAGEIE